MRYLIPLAMLLVAAAGCTTSPEPDRASIKLHFAAKLGKPLRDSLYPIYPNPFTRTLGDTAVAITFTMRDSGSAVVLIQNVLGDEIAGYSDTALSPGTYAGSWNPLASDGTALRSGLYFVTLRLSNYIQSRLVNLQNNE